jgi:hypothetical protein
VRGQTGSLLVACAAVVMLAGCAGDGAPTYTKERLTLHGCPGGRVRAHGQMHFSYTLTNTSRHAWSAAYLLLQPHGPIQTALHVAPHHQAGGIGGYVTRVAKGLGAGESLSGSIDAALNQNQVGSFKLGAWGAPANSIAEPSQMPARYCRLTP